MSIEEVAHNHPEKIFKLPIDLSKGLDVKDLIKAAKDLGLEEQQS
jgi:succinyl-CoA synthetase beta subunit